MNAADEHDDDLGPEVNEGAEIETESYEDVDDVDETEGSGDVTNPSGPGDGPAAQGGDHEHEDESSDTL
jgi:hypothetical protein